MHDDIKNSGVGRMLGISHLVSVDDERINFIGKIVRYKRELLTDEFISENGTICLDEVFEVKEVQNDYKGEPRIRGYAISYNDDFGRILNPAEMEILS